jgi:dethiobiotin synthetase
MSAWLITGTDTDVGKTLVSCALLRAFATSGKRCVGMKPVAAGVGANGCNDDVEALRAASTIAAPREAVNPYLFRAAVAPHLAALAEGRETRFAPIHAAFAQLRALADVVLVEGVGGFRVPLGVEGDSADLAQTLALPVVLVVGMRLGCLNHALLTCEAIEARGLRLAGWVANHIDPQMALPQQNLAALQEHITAPLLGEIPWLTPVDAGRAAEYLELPAP